MPEPHVILAHDLGTTGNKATLFDAESGQTLATAFQDYPTSYPHANWAEQDAMSWAGAVYGCTRLLLEHVPDLPGRVAAISFSGHMNGALLVDRDGLPLRPAIIWADQRAVSQAERMRAVYGEQQVYDLTGNRVSAAYTAAKVLWVKENQPEIYRRVYKVLQAKDYAAHLLTGRFATDYSDASATQVFDLKRRQWAADLIDALDLGRELWPEIAASTTVIGGLSKTAAVATGLKAGTPVVIGGGDGACATVGAGAVAEGAAYTYIGSSAWIAVTSKEPILDPQRRTFTFAHLDPEYYFALGAMQTAGGAFDWLERLWRSDGGEGSLLAGMDAQAEAVPAGSRGLLFLPYLLGERSPYWAPLARGAFVGLAMPHGRPEMTRAVLEGVAFNLRLILDALQAQGASVQAMRLIGGGARSAVWRQILADIFDLPILLPALAGEATSLGAAMAGGVGVGLFPDFSVASRLIPARNAERPEPGRWQCYAPFYQLFRESYQALYPVFEALARLS